MIRQEVRELPAYNFKAYSCPVKLDQNESPYDLPEPLKEKVLLRLGEAAFNRYPDLHADALRAALARHHRWPEEGIVVSSGSNVLIQSLVQACGIGQRVLTLTPSFSVYALQARLLGASLGEVPFGAGFSLPVRALKHELSLGQGVFFLANPAAPTGNLFGEGELRELIEAAPRWTIVIDEAYGQFSGSDFSTLARDYPTVACLRTFSKACGLAGVRLGHLLAQPDLARQLQKVVLPFSVSALGVAVGLSVLEEPHYLKARVAETLRERERVFKALAALGGVHVFPSHTNFLLFRVAEAGRVYEELQAKGVLVRRQDGLHGLAGCLRVSIGLPEENDAFIEAVTQIVSQVVSEGVSQGRPKETLEVAKSG